MKMLDIRPYDMVLYFTTDRAEFLRKRQEFEEPFDPGLLDQCNGMASDEGGTHLVGVFNDSIATLAHEMAHVAIKVLHHVGVKFDNEHQEVLCYLIGDLVDRCEGEFNRGRKSVVCSLRSGNPDEFFLE